jgi:hypothetical protein
MTATTPVERVAKILENARFKRVPTPLHIGGVEIEASAAFIGEPPSPDLVVVGDTIDQTPRRLQQTVEGVGRALDMMGSRRPLTLIVVGPRPESSAMTALSRHARVLTVGELADEPSLANWLAVLLPLKLPKAEDNRAEAATLKVLGASEDPLAREFVALGRQGRDSVAARLAIAVDEPFGGDDDTEQEA